MDKLYQNIKKIREAKGWTQEDLALKVGYAGRASVSAIESGKVNLPSSKIKQFAEALGVPSEELLDADDVALMPSNIEIIVEEAKTCTDTELQAVIDILKAFNRNRKERGEL